MNFRLKDDVDASVDFDFYKKTNPTATILYSELMTTEEHHNSSQSHVSRIACLVLDNIICRLISKHNSINQLKK